MAPVGHATSPAAIPDSLGQARQRAALIPDLLADARRVASTVISGWHGRRKRGIGENFWQFRPYAEGEAVSRIDWRRSARDEHVYLRDNEWEAAHTIWLWADRSPSMRFRSGRAVSKEDRALVLIFAMAELLSRAGERIAWPGVTEPSASRSGAERLAARLSIAPPQSGMPDARQMRRFSELVIASDFLDDHEAIIARLEPLAARGLRGHLVEIADPAEEEFPYAGRTEFEDPETGLRLTAGRAEAFADNYKHAYAARRAGLAAWAAGRGWSFTVSRTDRPATLALAFLHRAISEPGAG